MVVASSWELCLARALRSTLQFLSSPFQGQGVLCHTPERRLVSKWRGGSLEGHGETIMVSLLRGPLAACTNTLSSSWGDSWPAPPGHSREVSSKPCSSACCASFVLSFLVLGALQALQLLPGERHVPEARDSSGSEWKAVSSGLAIVAKHSLVLYGCGEA